MFDFVLDDSEAKGGFWWFISCSPASKGWLRENAIGGFWGNDNDIRVKDEGFNDLLRRMFHAGLKGADTHGQPIYCGCSECKSQG